jgi:hypothetical protein
MTAYEIKIRRFLKERSSPLFQRVVLYKTKLGIFKVQRCVGETKFLFSDCEYA